MTEDRKLRILAAVVDEYIRTGEPVGSKAIASMPGMKVSSATVRNDMAVLESLGYLEQPHTSAGRVPTYQGLRLYVEKLMPQTLLSEDDKKMLDEVIEKTDPSEDALIDSASRVLSELTNCTAVANISPKYTVITKIDAIPTGRRMYVLLMITSSGNIRNKVCRLEFDLSHEQLEFFTEFMTRNLSGISVDSLSDDMIKELAAAMGAYTMSLSPLLGAVKDLARAFSGNDVRMTGEKNLLSRKDVDPQEIIRFLEQRNELSSLLDESFGGLRVIFGGDSMVISNSSMLVAPIMKGERAAGSLSLIGPVRLDYKKVIPYLEYLTEKISKVLTENNEEYRLITVDNNDEQVPALTEQEDQS